MRLLSFIRRYGFWLLVCLISLLVWIVRWIPESFERFYNIVFVSWDYYPRVLVRGSMYSLAAIGLVARLVGVILGLVCVYMIWRRKMGSFSLRKPLGVAIGLEGVYYASFIPSIFYLFALGDSWNSVFYSILGFGYFLHVSLTVPLLAVLAIKVLRSEGGLDNFHSWRWIGITFLGYIGALWANTVFRWFSIGFTEGESFLWADSTGFLAWNALILMSLALVFAVFGAYNLSSKKSSSFRWVGLSLVMVGLHYLFYVIYHFYIDALISVWLIDVWAFSLLGLGLLILKKSQTLKIFL